MTQVDAADPRSAPDAWPARLRPVPDGGGAAPGSVPGSGPSEGVGAALAELLAVPGADHARAVEAGSGRVRGEAGRDAGAAAAVLEWAAHVGAPGRVRGLEDLMLTTDRAYHLVRPVTDGPSGRLWVYLRVDRARGTLARARRALAGLDLERTRPRPPVAAAGLPSPAERPSTLLGLPASAPAAGTSGPIAMPAPAATSGSPAARAPVPADASGSVPAAASGSAPAVVPAPAPVAIPTRAPGPAWFSVPARPAVIEPAVPGAPEPVEPVEPVAPAVVEPVTPAVLEPPAPAVIAPPRLRSVPTLDPTGPADTADPPAGPVGLFGTGPARERDGAPRSFHRRTPPAPPTASALFDPGVVLPTGPPDPSGVGSAEPVGAGPTGGTVGPGVAAAALPTAASTPRPAPDPDDADAPTLRTATLPRRADTPLGSATRPRIPPRPASPRPRRSAAAARSSAPVPAARPASPAEAADPGPPAEAADPVLRQTWSTDAPVLRRLLTGLRRLL